ncbi:lysosomal alpha-mannosidase isoform X1 [Manduca sexta]|uniref:lysosomal alpha-mannosidase isoform X1 n=2 Tax=Manduca sexta TaxID=7130 RepID=UPI00188EED45|nr:lysosomal alpha-mannosidase isoform X1 [Manduca sexta]
MVAMLKLLVLLVTLAGVFSVPLQDKITPRSGEACGYESCPVTENGVLNVHIVAHTHDDVGWLKTVDQYYYGSRNRVQKAGVQYIIDSVVKELWEDPKRKFIYVETAFFWKWWVRQPESIRDKVHTLVRQGRLQFVGGAWSMNDEAASHYQSTIDQFTWGLSKLNETFGTCGLPRVGWQIDPFGHSREFASLLAAMGYDGLFLGRIDYQDKSSRLHNQDMEMVWRGDDVLGKSSDIFTGVLFNTYSPPPGFCFDVLCDDEPIIDDPDSPLFNVDDKIAVFLDYVKKQSLHYRTQNVIVTMGGDFTYQDASMWYKNLDKLIEYANLKSAKDGLNVKLFYSTPTCYLKSVRDANPELPIKQDDFFPYASDSTAYWTGYFTSRPTTKYFEREGNNYLQMVKQLQVLAGLEEHNKFVLNELKSAMGVMQHHDAITGTEKQHVTHDYERLLNQAIDDALLIARQAFNKVTQGDALKPPLFEYARCRLNESSCHASETSDQFIITVYNSLGWDLKEALRIPVVEGSYEVYAPNGQKIDSQLVPIPPLVLKIPTRHSSATHELVFIARLHALGIKSFYIKKIKKNKRDSHTHDYYNVGSNVRSHGLNVKPTIIDNFENRAKRDTSDLDITFHYYPGCVGNNRVPANRSSGAYIFRPNATSPKQLNPLTTENFNGVLVDEKRVVYDQKVLSVRRHYKELEFIENEWLVGPIDISDDVGKEFAVRYQSDILNNGEFYTDSNGRQVLKRKLNQRPQWNVTLAEPIAGNYYPVTNEIYIENGDKRLTVLTDRSQGGTSLQEGQVELMLHRRLLHDDAFGVGEALNETANGEGLVVRGRHRIFTTKDEVLLRKNILQLHQQPIVFVSEAHIPYDQWLTLDNCHRFLKSSLPDGLHLLTLEPRGEQLLLRFENYKDTNMQIDISNLFDGIKINGIHETNLAGNRWKEDVESFEWRKEREFADSFNKQYGGNGETSHVSSNGQIQDEGFNVALKGKEIRTFVIDYDLVKKETL